MMEEDVLHIHFIAVEIGIVRRRSNKLREKDRISESALHTQRDLDGRLEGDQIRFLRCNRWKHTHLTMA
jgi:hypothetical protein